MDIKDIEIVITTEYFKCYQILEKQQPFIHLNRLALYSKIKILRFYLFLYFCILYNINKLLIINIY